MFFKKLFKVLLDRNNGNRESFGALVFFLLLFLIVVSLTACGKVKVQEDKVVRVNSATEVNGSQGTFEQLSEFYSLYASNRGFTAAELENLAKKFKDKLEATLGVTGLPVEDVMETLIQFSPEAADGVSADGVLKGIQRRVSFFHWFESAREISFEQITSKVNEQFSGASDEARSGFLRIMKKFDETWASGNGNGVLGKKELAFPILITSTLYKLSFEAQELPSELEGVPEWGVGRKQFFTRLEEQVFGRYSGKSYQSLSEADRRLEVISLSLRIYQMNLLMGAQGVQGVLYPTSFDSAFRSFSFLKEPVDVNPLVRLYDLPLMGGERDGNLNASEMFFLTLDLELAQKWEDLVSKDKDDDDSSGVWPQFAPIFPKIASDIKFSAVRLMYRESAHSSSLIKRAQQIGRLHILNLVFELYDEDGNNRLSREEAEPLFQKLGVSKENEKRAFFEDVGLEEGSSKFLSGLRLTLRLRKKQELAPTEFYVRMTKLLPQLVDK